MPANAVFALLIELMLPWFPDAHSPNPDREQAAQLQLDQSGAWQSQAKCPQPIGKIARSVPDARLAIGAEQGCCYSHSPLVG